MQDVKCGYKWTRGHRGTVSMLIKQICFGGNTDFLFWWHQKLPHFKEHKENGLKALENIQ